MMAQALQTTSHRKTSKSPLKEAEEVLQAGPGRQRSAEATSLLPQMDVLGRCYRSFGHFLHCAMI